MQIDFRVWHETDMTGPVGDVRSRGYNGSRISTAAGLLMTQLAALVQHPICGGVVDLTTLG
jgi:hypothetical protein